jgi:hypothetical protein
MFRLSMAGSMIFGACFEGFSNRVSFIYAHANIPEANVNRPATCTAQASPSTEETTPAIKAPAA